MGDFAYFMLIVLSGFQLHTLMLLQELAEPLPFTVVALTLANLSILARILHVKRKLKELEGQDHLQGMISASSADRPRIDLFRTGLEILRSMKTKDSKSRTHSD